MLEDSRAVMLNPDSPKANFNFEYANIAPSQGLFKKRKLIDRKIVSGKIDEKLMHNGISTSKYNLITFIPLNLFQQFSKIANIYFLAIGIMQSITVISVSNGTPDIFVPLFVIVIISAFKDLFEDIKRHRSDNEENSKPCNVLDLQTGEFVKKSWKRLRVGEIIKIVKDEYVPADMLILLSSSPKGEAFIETKNLDGETNLKHKTVPKTVLKTFLGVAGGEFNTNEKIIFDFEAPNPYLYTFNGSVTTKEGERVPLDANNFILRGCSLRNTNWMYGLVTYTGHETKIMLNSVKARPKKSKLERMMGNTIIVIFCFQILLCLFCAIYYAVWFEQNEDDLSYLDVSEGSSDANGGYNFGTRFGNWMIIFSNFVPISLLVTLEMVKFFQGMLIAKDPDMIHKETNTPTNVQSSNLNEELGQIEYVFSDKTGTLTQNYMEFRKLIAKGKPYGIDRSVEDISKFPQVTNVNFRDKNFLDALNRNDRDIEDYLLALGVCHTIITENKDGEIVYNASSPDELALVNFAKFVGCEYMGMDEDSRMLVSFKNTTHKYRLLQVLEFNSKRKRMSVIVEDGQGRIILYCKGADSILLELMDKSKNPEIDETQKYLGEFADEGLRTLLICNKVIPKNEYDEWSKRYLNACVATENRQEKMEELQAEIEKGLRLIGATAIEDKLQDDVGGTIAFLKKAGIKVWVLTGDKIETAINIGFSCNLLTKELERLIVDGKSYEEVQKSLNDAKAPIDEAKRHGGELKFALIVSGDALIQAMKEPLSTQMMEIANVCEAVICCRVAPKQKAEVVQLVRKTKPDVSTLAIGDGANDVNMITAAHVGIGIRGVEGQQAARASDYAIGEFKLLKKLLVHHGRECYRKNSNLILFNFFKNIILVLPLFWIGFDMIFSGQRVYESWLYSLFNVFYSSVPIIVYALFDSEFADDSLMKYPFLYFPGIQYLHFNKKRFAAWFCNAVVQSVIVGILSLYIMSTSAVTESGRVLDMWCSGALILGLCVVISNFKVVTFSHNHSFASMFFIFGSIAIYLLSIAIVNFMSTSDLYDQFEDIFSTPNFYFANIMILCATSFMDYGQERHGMITRAKHIKKMKKAVNNNEVVQTPELAKASVKKTPSLTSVTPISTHQEQMQQQQREIQLAENPSNHLTQKPQTPQQQQNRLNPRESPEATPILLTNPSQRRPAPNDRKPTDDIEVRIDNLLQEQRAMEPSMKRRIVRGEQHTGYAFSQLERENPDDFRKHYQN